jgi:hypothetical protein
MVAQVISIFLLLLGRRYAILQRPGMIVLWIVVVLAFVSAVDYFRLFWREALKPSARPVVVPAQVENEPPTVERAQPPDVPRRRALP